MLLSNMRSTDRSTEFDLTLQRKKSSKQP